MSRRAQENIAAAVILAVFAGVIVMCQDFGPRARMIPLPLAIVGVVLTLIQIVWQNLGSTDTLQMDMITVEAPGAGAKPDEKPKAEGKPSWMKEAAAFGIVAVLLVLVMLLGPIPAVFLFTGGYFAWTRHYSLRAGLIYTAIFTAATYLLFFVALEIQPYHGLLAPVLDRF